MKAILVIATVLVCVTSVMAVDIDLKWDAVAGATGYRVWRSLDGGVNYAVVTTDPVTGTSTKLLAQPEDKLILYRVSAYDSNSEVVRYWSGAWYDHRFRPISAPGGNSVP